MKGPILTAAFTAAFGHILREQRIQAQLTQEELAWRADLQRNYVSELEHGKKQASVVTMFKLASALHVVPHEFVKQVGDAYISASLKRGRKPSAGKSLRNSAGSEG